MKIIEEYLQCAVADDVFPGCCAVIIDQDKIDYFCCGVRQLYPNIHKNHLDTLYDIASLSKVIATTSLTLRFIQEGHLHFNTIIKDIIPMFQHEKITLYHLLTHTSGLPADYQWEKGTSETHIINDICHMNLLFEPGEHVLYSDMGYIILGEVLKNVGHSSLDKLVEDYVFKPLHFEHTMYAPSIDYQKICATTEYDKEEDTYFQGIVHDPKARLMGGIAGHAGVFMPISDLAKYLQMLLKKGQVCEETYLDEKFIKMMYTTLTPLGNISRGIGYLTKDDRNPFPQECSKQSLLHTGFTGTSLFVDIKNQLAVGLLSARIHPTRENDKIISWRRQFHEKVWECYRK